MPLVRILNNKIKVANGLLKVAAGTAVTWILELGFWNDGGTWKDGSTWID